MAISAEFTADFSQFTDAAKGAEQAINGVTDASARIGADTPRHAQVVGAALRDVALKAKDFATEYIAAFAEEEAATKRLESAITASGRASADVLPRYQDMAAQFQTMTRYSDDAVLSAQTTFTQIARLGPEQMQPAIQAAADLAAGLGIGIEEAARKIAMVIGTDGAKLGTLKALLGDVDVKGKSAAEVLEIFNSKFGGAAAADRETTIGQMEHFNNVLDDFKGKVGGVLATALTPLLDAFTSLDPVLQTAIAGGTALLAVLVPIGVAVGSFLSGVTALVTSLGGWAAVMTTIETAVAAVAWPITAAVAAVTALYLAWKYWDEIVVIVQNVYNAVKTYLVDKFNAVVGAILHPIDTVTNAFKSMYDAVVGRSYVPDMIDGIAEQFGRLQDVMVGPTLAAAGHVNEALGGIQLPGSSVGGDRGTRYLMSPTGNRVPMSDTGSLPDNWWDVYSGASNFADVISDLGRPATGIGSTVINITQPLGDPQAIALAVEDAMNRSLRTSGVRLPAGA